MKLKSVKLQNFRAFQELEIPLHPQLTIFVGNNADGKTTILDAIAIGLGAILTRLPDIKGRNFGKYDLRQSLKKTDKLPKITDSLVKQIEYAPFVRVTLIAETVEKTTIIWDRTAKKTKSKDFSSNIKLAQLHEYLDKIIEAINNEEEVYLPVVAYYGTERAVLYNAVRNFNKDFDRYNALERALEADQRLSEMLQWFAFQEDMERRLREEQKDYTIHLPILEAVKKAICQIIPYSSNPRTLLNPLHLIVTIEHPDWTETEILSLEQLSDGYRTILAMCMDLARRLAQANPFYGVDSCLAPAVVLIDEIDLHLHPSWQQTILSTLMQVFPNVQFIVTTHSQAVLTTVKAENIWQLERCKENGICAYRPIINPYASESHRVLHSIMHVDPRPQNLPEVANLQDYLQMVNQGEYDTFDALALRQKLENSLGKDEPGLNLADMLIRKHKVLGS
jgi:predicted ATP-binding protein involved in virulence